MGYGLIMNSIIEAIREAKEVKDSFIGSGKIGNAKSSSGIKQDRVIRVDSIKDSDDLARELLVNIKEDDYLSIKQVLYVMGADMGVYRL